MLTKREAIDGCVEECVSSFEDNYLDDFVSEGMDIFIDDMDQEADDIVDTVFFNNDVDSDNMTEWIDDYCSNILSRGQDEELVFDYGIDEAMDNYGDEYGYKCGDMIYGIMHELMGSSEREDAISQMKDSVISSLEDRIEERKELLEHRKERFTSARNHIQSAMGDVCDFYETCYSCPFYNKVNEEKYNVCSLSRIIGEMDRIVAEEVDKENDSE